MRITTIGTGTAAPHPHRAQGAALVEVADVRLLIDCGSAAVLRMAELGIDWAGLTHVAVTHFHADHIADVATLIYAWRHGRLPPRSAPAELIGPPGWAARMEAMRAVFGEGLLDQPPPITITELPAGASHPLADGIVLGSYKVPHTPESVAYSVSGRGRRVVVSGDTGFDTGLAAWAVGCDVLVCECSLPDELALPTHLTPRECGALAAIAQPGQLVLTHFYPPVESVDIIGQVAGAYTGPVVCAHDGWSVDLGET